MNTVTGLIFTDLDAVYGSDDGLSLSQCFICKIWYERNANAL